MTKERPGKYVRDHYRVPAYIGRRVAFTDTSGGRHEGRITGFRDSQYLLIRYDDPTLNGRNPAPYHPTWNIEYLEADK